MQVCQRPNHTPRVKTTAARAALAGGRIGALALGLLGVAGLACAADLTVSPSQKQTAQKVAEQGVPLSELAPDAPESHTVVSGDTLWDISKLFLKSPWRWPELWGMNMAQIRNPHLIYPGQMLVLVRGADGRAHLKVADGGGGPPGSTVKLSPRTRSSELDKSPIASIPMHLIEPFLTMLLP